MSSATKHGLKESASLYGFSVLYAVFVLGMSANFFLAPNPFAARHSGDAAREAAVVSGGWFLHVGLLLAISICIALLWHRVKPDSKIILLVAPILFWFMFSGLASSVIMEEPQTYFYNMFAFLGIALIARYDAGRNDAFNGVAFYNAVVLLCIAGVVLALMRPMVWGKITVEFSRAAKGEATLASLIAGPLLIGVGLAAFRPNMPKITVLLATGLIVLECSFAKRTSIWMVLFPVTLSFCFAASRKYIRRSHARKLLSYAIPFVGFLTGVAVVYYVATNYYDLDAITTGRFTLWKFHWRQFLENWLFGSGAHLVTRLHYTGKATSEVGVLSAFSQYGIVFGLLQVGLVTVALFRAVRRLLFPVQDRMVVMASYVVITCFPIWVFNSYSRIIGSASMIFWYSVFYLLFCAQDEPVSGPAGYEDSPANTEGSSVT